MQFLNLSGNGYSNNGVQDTSKEYIVRGDIPLKMMAGQTYILKSPSKVRYVPKTYLLHDIELIGGKCVPESLSLPPPFFK